MELLASRLNGSHPCPNNPYAPLQHHVIQTHDRGTTISEHLRQHTRIQRRGGDDARSSQIPHER
jgi:hypothetical protein